MAMYYNFTNAHQQPPPTSHSHHGGRNRRAPRLSVSQNAQRQFRGARNMKEFNESASLSTFRTKFEAVRSFELEDDIEFCPALLTESDVSTPGHPCHQDPIQLTHSIISWSPSPARPSAPPSPATRHSRPQPSSHKLWRLASP